jgi:hypothetical protein
VVTTDHPGALEVAHPPQAGRRGQAYPVGQLRIGQPAYLGVLAWLASRGADWLRRSAVQRWLERATGVVLIGFGVRLATESR